jgi:hypothetical protein
MKVAFFVLGYMSLVSGNAAECTLGTCDSDVTSLMQTKTSIKKAGPSEAKTLTEILRNTGTDKMWRHGYHRYYEKQLAPYRHVDGARILEIGADKGPSLGAWLEYFEKPEVVQGLAYGVDADAAQKEACSLMPTQCSKLKIYSMDQGNVTALASLVQNNPTGWDVVIDDGSHLPQHQLLSFQKLWPNIRPGGLYAIEDIETSYVDNGFVYAYPLHAGIGKDAPVNAVEGFKHLADVVNRKHFSHPELTAFNGIDHDVASVNFADGLIFVEKKPADPTWDNFPNNLVFGPANVDASVNEHQPKLDQMNQWFANLK